MKLKTIGLTLALSGAITLAQADDAQIAKGKEIVEKLKCSICHAIDGKGSKRFKPLNGITEDHSDEFLRGSLVTPKETLGADTKMPSYKGKMSDEEVAAVILYMKSLK